MPKSPLKPCRHPGCPNLSEERYCEKHPTERTAATKEADKDYNIYRRDKESQSFYDSDAWRKLRKQQLSRQPLCAMCLQEGRFNKAQVADHVIPIRQGGGRLDINNLQSLCWSCHSKKSKSERR
jgi:5-methylcytosine-specific restriction protein A